MSQNTRKESDSIGTLNIPEDAYYGVQSLRGYQNFQITGLRANDRFIKNIVKIKKAAAIVNGRIGSVPKDIANAIILACDEALDGNLDDGFITDPIQGGAGTTFNMNVNEVIANRATELLGGKKGEYLCHPNDHVNCAQSTNDVIPSAGKMTVIELMQGLLHNLRDLIDALTNRALAFDHVIKMGRTQLEDAVPIRLGQEFRAYANAMKRAMTRIEETFREMFYLNLGGTAIGT
ncbi:MAG: aspartate ammonia-lyase, partial [Clostridia bacterium]|nr:aspartate ammonia-lyase [Clostridia bacterium]